MNADLVALVRSYRPHGEVKAGELLLPPELAVAFAYDLARLGIQIDGVDFWRVHCGNVIEIPWGGNAVGNSIAERAADATRMILEERPTGAVYASLVFPGYDLDDPSRLQE